MVLLNVVVVVNMAAGGQQSIGGGSGSSCVVTVELSSGSHQLTQTQVSMYLTYVTLGATFICYRLIHSSEVQSNITFSTEIPWEHKPGFGILHSHYLFITVVLCMSIQIHPLII